MKNITFLLYVFSVGFLVSCSSYGTAVSNMEQGRYAEAFDVSISVFQKDKSEKKKDKQLIVMQSAYLKANEEDERYLNKLKAGNDYKKIYQQTLKLYNRVNKIKPHLPLYKNGKELVFPTPDYSKDLIKAKEKYLSSYYEAGERLLSGDKKDARNAYEILKEVRSVERNYRSINSLLAEAYDKGVDIVNVNFANRTGFPIPSDFEQHLFRDINRSVNDFWTKIITDNTAPRDYVVDVTLRQAFIGRDIVTSHTYNFEREIVDGWEYLKDKRGNIVKDSLGNARKIDRIVLVRARVTEFIRQKEAMLSADVDTYRAIDKKFLDNKPIASNFAFAASFATLEGDVRAIPDSEKGILNLIAIKPLAFPNDYDMIHGCLEDFRRQLIYRLEKFN